MIPKVTPFPQTSHLAILLHLLILTLHADRRKIDFCGSLQTNISILSNFPKKSNPFHRILLNIFFTIKIPFEKYNYLRKQTVKSTVDLFSKSNRKRNRHISGILSCGNLVNFMSNGKIGLNFSGKPCIIKRTHYRVSGQNIFIWKGLEQWEF